MLSLAQEPLVLAHQNTTELDVAELFDKYNLQTLPVVDKQNKLTGVITSDDVISMLRGKL
jgi:Mg/Co/Ni transporter MgtE